MTGKKEEFVPLTPKTVRMYVCGVTVYDYCHIGHARSALVFDVIRRYLEYSGYRVEFAKNFTDVDDKIIKRANEQGVSCEEVTAKFIQAYYDDMGRLGVRPASIEPKATEHMADIVRLTETLIAKGLAYQVDGDVYFEVAKYGDYGRLSKRKLDDLQAGARVDVDERKRHPMDFALWKSAKPGEPAWPSPWGQGRPGWHIECSAMSIRHTAVAVLEGNDYNTADEFPCFSSCSVAVNRVNKIDEGSRQKFFGGEAQGLLPYRVQVLEIAIEVGDTKEIKCKHKEAVRIHL